MIKLRNATNQEFIINFVLFRESGTTDDTYTIPQESLSVWGNSSDALIKISNGDLILSQFDIDKTDPSEAISILKGLSPSLVDVSNPKSPVTERLEVSVNRPEGESFTISSHDFGDPCSWYQNSVEITGEVLSTQDNLTYQAANERWIDLTHGRMYEEHEIANKRIPVIRVGGVDVFSGFTIDYENGRVIFDSPQSGQVTADYWYATSSTFSVVPPQGKQWILEHTELQFTTDLVFGEQNIEFDVFAFNPFDLPNKISVQKQVYKSVKDIINNANLGQGTIPAMDALSNPVVVFPFNYSTIVPMRSSQGIEIRISISNDEPLNVEFGTATFYIIERDE